MKALAAEASEIAAELHDPEATALAAAARRRAYWDPVEVDRRLADSTLLRRAAREAGDTELALQGHAWLVVDLLEHGESDAVDAQIEAFTAGAMELRQPLFLWQATVWRAMRSLLAGHLEQADALAAEALSSGIRGEEVTAPQYYAIQLLGIRREQGRMAELEEATRRLLIDNPHRPAWRAGLATLLCATGRPAEAQAEFDTVAASGFADIPRDGDWMIAITLLADLAYELADRPRAQLLYELLAPYEQANVVIGIAVVCLGAAARYLGRLAAATGRRDAAIGHLEHAIEANTALNAPVQLAHTELDLAQLIGPGARADSLIATAERTARELGLPAVLDRVQRQRRN
jgi:tetratricopeptide (TPR) repeat protein